MEATALSVGKSVLDVDGALGYAKSAAAEEGEGLRVIAVWGTGGDLAQASIISEAYENPDIKNKFPWQASVRVLHPFNPNDFIQSLVMQFRSAVGVDVLLETEKPGKELAEDRSSLDT
jgi:hypothetical protein